jgi:CHAD domain-containing protein
MTRQLAEQSTDETDTKRWYEFESRLCARRDEMINASVLDSASMRLRIGQLRLVADALSGSGIGDPGRAGFIAAAKKARKKARKAFVRLQRDPSEDNFHSLRKRTKRELYQQQLLVRIGLRSEDSDLDKLDSLCQSLGDKQDLAVLDRLAGDCGIELSASQRQLLDGQSERLSLESIGVARTLYT